MENFDAFLSHFERELALLRQDMLSFERAFPEAAARLSLSGGQTADPHVERLTQSAAWMNARSARRIEDHYPEFAEALIETVFPAYLRPVPSCSIAQFDVSNSFHNRAEMFTMPRGTELEQRPSLCPFTTVYDVTLAPLEIAGARFAPATAAPVLEAGLLASDTAGIISIEFACPREDGFLPGSILMPPVLRVYLDTDRFLAAALIDAILLRPQTAFVEADGNRCWHALDHYPVSIAGFDDRDALVEEPRFTHSHPAFRLLIEYAVFPQKFRFIDIDFAALLHVAGPCGRLALHLPVAGQASSEQIQRLGELDRRHLRLFCTPVVNRFRLDAEPANVKAGVSCYPVVMPEREGPLAVIGSIDSVRMMQGDQGKTPGLEIPRHRALRHWSPVGAFWLVERDTWIAREETGSDTAIHVVDLDERPFVVKATKLAIALTCTNGDAPCTLDIGLPDGDLHSEVINVDGPITLLERPSKTARPPHDDKALWRLISALSPNHTALLPSGLATLRALLRQLGEFAAPDSGRYIEGIVGLNCRMIQPLMSIDGIPTPVLVAGIQVRLTVDDAAFAGDALHTFALLMQGHFLRYAGRDCLQLIVAARDGTELHSGEPVLGPPGLGCL